ncbi:hypothetical protein GIB67_005194 [Kingdonia uniflora]|uniref:Uncharacterized protein n=1 Tax=Kingdonia uniflora TaxID=39325 RepID=A0A7J7NNQ5_9MAGN|nr:hypothetical protein GIB67_005194 [Kingdonia uniflora]
MRSKNVKPSSKFVVSASSEESSSSDRTMDDSVAIGTVTADNLLVSSGRGVGLHTGDKTEQLFKYPKNVDVAKKFLQYKKSLDGEWGNYVMNAGLWFRTLVRPSGNMEHYQVPFLDRWKRSMHIGDDIDIFYYNGTRSKVEEERFFCYLNQVAYGLSIPLSFFQKGVMNALKSCPGQLNGNIFEMMRVCKVFSQKWRDGGIVRQFIADNVLKYYKFKYVKDRKSGYLFSDSARPKFFDFESSRKPWCDNLVMVREPNPKVVADTSSLFDIVSREGSELNKVLGELGIHKEKRLNSVVEKIPACVMGTSSSLVWRPRIKKTVPPSEQAAPVQLPPVVTEGVVADVNMAPSLKKQKKEYGKDIRASSKGLSVAWKSVAEVLKLAAANRAELVRQHDAEKVTLQEQFEQEKMLQREQFEKEKVLQREQFEKEAAATKQEVEDEVKKAVDIAVASQNKLIKAFYVWGLSREDVDLALAGKYGEIIFQGMMLLQWLSRPWLLQWMIIRPRR